MSSAPPVTGMRMSEMTRSKRVRRMRSSAAAPLAAISTWAPVSDRISARFSANAWLSSTTRYLRTGLPDRQADDEARPVLRSRLVGDAAAVALDDAPDEREAQTDAFGLGGDQRLEQALADGGVDAGSGVLDREHQFAAGRRSAHAHLAGGAHRVHRVLEEIDQDLPQLAHVGGDVGKTVQALGDDMHVRRPLHRRDRVGDHRRQPRRRDLERTIADHVEEVGDDRVGDGDLLADPVGGLARALVRDAAAQDEQRALHDPEGIAQLVPDRADELPERREPLAARLLGDDVLAVGVEHDRQLEVEDLVDGGADAILLGEAVAEQPGDADELEADDVHRTEHVMLRQPDADMEPTDARTPLAVRLVPRASEERVEPGFECDLQAADVALAVLQRLARLVVLEDAAVEDVGDVGELRGRARVQGAQRLFIVRAPLDVPLELFEQGLDSSLHVGPPV